VDAELPGAPDAGAPADAGADPPGADEPDAACADADGEVDAVPGGSSFRSWARRKPAPRASTATTAMINGVRELDGSRSRYLVWVTTPSEREIAVERILRREAGLR
jgi:hypothetical protein